MTSRERILQAIDHRATDRIPVDFGSGNVTGIHCSVVADLRRHFGLEDHPVRVPEPLGMLGTIEDDLKDAMGIDTTNLPPPKTNSGFPNDRWMEFRTPWGQIIEVTAHLKFRQDPNGDLFLFAHEDPSAPPTAHMPAGGFFFDTIPRQQPIDEDNLEVADNLEEYGLLDAPALDHWRRQAEALRDSPRAVVAHLPGTGLGDIARVLAPGLARPKGVRGVEEWYILTATRPDFLAELFERQTDIALENLASLHAAIGDRLDVAIVCGTDFGTQNSQFCSVQSFEDVWMPSYRRINDWIHRHTTWKTLKHSCGAVNPLIPKFIDAGFDILNPVQCSADGMDPARLKAAYGNDITFWGGGVDTQKTLPFGSPEDVRTEVSERCRIFSQHGGFVFNSIHNIQALTPTENVIAMLDAARAAA
jgi:hypothetical protein